MGRKCDNFWDSSVESIVPIWSPTDYTNIKNWKFRKKKTSILLHIKHFKKICLTSYKVSFYKFHNVTVYDS